MIDAPAIALRHDSTAGEYQPGERLSAS